ncbi:MAG: secondary thiamine-phosphate synthase enzyme YjbQ [Candidatus Woesearchaeota archaeon]|nr:secondary thiamine-phosphate synthase enzyme YjbQ [Candidatus Woesearchaeota archaeon]
MIKRIELNTKKRFEVIDITDDVRKAVSESKIKSGICNVYTKHTTSAITINENEDTNIRDDILDSLNFVQRGIWKHDKICERTNGDAHVKASFIGPSETMPIIDGELILGKYQDIYFCEFDGPRESREIIISIIKG